MDTDILVSVVWTRLKFRVPKLWDTENRKSKRVGRPQIRAPKFWDMETS